MIDLKEITLQVCRIAEHAGHYLKSERERFTMDKVEIKHSHDYVSYVDKNSEKQLVEALKKLPIMAGFITEEKTASYDGEDYCWVIDPLDGTTNYIHHYQPYAVSIALRKGNELLIGVVYEVCSDECFYAWKDGGAYMNGQSIHVNKNNDLDKSLLGIELPYNDEYKKIGLHLIEHFYGLAGAIRMNGSAASALCYVAAGRMDGWLEKFIGVWDFSAGILIIKEAGGIISNFSGKSDYLDGDNIVASNGIIHQDLLDAIKQ